MSVNPLSAGDDIALSADLDEEFARVEVGPAPVEAVLSHGRSIRSRRRALAGTGLAVAAVLGTSLFAVRGVWWGDAVSPAGGGARVTVDSPHPGKDGRLVFSGTVNGKVWTAAVDGNGCVMPFGACLPDFPPVTDPASVSTTWSTGEPDRMIFDFRSDVARLDVEVKGGPVVTLVPASVKGGRIGLLTLPEHSMIDRVAAYGADGREIGFAIPFNPGLGAPLVVSWYQPGEAPTAVDDNAPIATAKVAGEDAWVSVAVGPYGTCVTKNLGSGPGDVSCESAKVSAQSDDLLARTAWATGLAPTPVPYWFTDVHLPQGSDHVVFTFADGSTQRQEVATIAGHRCVAALVPAGARLTAIHAYRHDGSVVVATPPADANP